MVWKGIVKCSFLLSFLVIPTSFAIPKDHRDLDRLDHSRVRVLADQVSRKAREVRSEAERYYQGGEVERRAIEDLRELDREATLFQQEVDHARDLEREFDRLERAYDKAYVTVSRARFYRYLERNFLEIGRLLKELERELDDGLFGDPLLKLSKSVELKTESLYRLAQKSILGWNYQDGKALEDLRMLAEDARRHFEAARRDRRYSSQYEFRKLLASYREAKISLRLSPSLNYLHGHLDEIEADLRELRNLYGE
ncbi:MAG: hypothetical protein HYW47_01885 [Deltaproteobacteria bacterium]|nr:hypothetical protein [Deltaproteobacteria bacterium]